MDKRHTLLFRRLEAGDPAYTQIADQIRELILAGQLEKGERLPPEAELAELFGTSRSTAREAIRVLSSEGLLTTIRGRSGGTFVDHPAVQETSAYLKQSLELMSGSVTVAHLLECREMLEVPAAGLAAERATQKSIDRISAAVVDERDLEQVEDPTEAAEMLGNLRFFHSAILQASGNVLLELMATPVYEILRKRVDRSNATIDFWIQVNADHKNIARAIMVGDKQRAADGMTRHLAHLRTAYPDMYR